MISTLFLAVFFVVLVVLLTPAMLVSMLVGIRGPVLGFWLWAVRVSWRVLGIRIEVEGLERFDARRSHIFMPNHGSFMDGPLVMTLVRGAPRVILKRSILRIPVLGLAMRHVGFVPVDRKGAAGGKKSIAQAAALIRERGYSFLIFPEGTRSRDGRLQPFKRGGFFLALASGAPIVPVTLRGTFELMPKGQWYARRGRVRVIFHDPLSVAGLTEEAMGGLVETVRERILSGMAGEDRVGTTEEKGSAVGRNGTLADG